MDAQSSADPASRTGATRAGYVVLAGLPNAGKSTLLNALVGEHLSIVTPRAQTTWERVAGIRSEAGVQMVFLDTPGVLSSPRLFHRSMMAEAKAARDEADVVVGVVDGTAPGSPARQRTLRDFLERCRCPAALAVNKADHRRFAPEPAGELAGRLQIPAFAVSALRSTGLGVLLAFLRTHLPAGPFLYPEDDIAIAPTRYFVQELVRETVFENFRQEIPYSVAVRVEDFREGEDPVYIAVGLYVERKSQKGMLIGKGGAGIRAVGTGARARIEHFLGRPVYLDLWVKVWPGWRRKKEGLMAFGYRVPDDGP
ncbi:MAG: GTPase Era [Gemmatimonadota bacterium]|nr:GTPase Era [Gemmatimonadota bacterium]MDE2985212.1 GTPase Era [Gemmatimonadota bacterium]